MIKLSTREVERIVAQVFDVPDRDKLALRARMENLRKKGFPSGLATGRGKVASFGLEQLTDLSVALALIDAGLSPEYAALAVEDMDGMAHRFFALLRAQELPRDRLKHALEAGFWPSGTSITARCSVHRLLGAPGNETIRVATWAISSSIDGRQPSDSGLSAVHIDFGTLFIRLVSAIAEMTGKDGFQLASHMLDRPEDHVVHS
jgi:hypothetical protein